MGQWRGYGLHPALLQYLRIIELPAMKLFMVVNKLQLLPQLLLTLAPFCSRAQTARETLHTKMGVVSFDKSITGFQFAAIMKERFVYSINGKKDLSSATPKTGFYIDVVKDMDYGACVAYVMKLTDQFSQSNPGKMTTTLKDTVLDIQGRKSFCSSFSVFDRVGKKINAMFIAAISVDDKALMFFSTDYSKNNYLPKFFKTFQSIQF